MSAVIVFYVLVFIFGTIVGSFLNVLILRYNTGISAMKGRSFCFSCGKKLGPLELIPVLSFIVQGGKCHGCKSKISWQYPVIECLTGLLFMGVFMKYSNVVSLYFNTWYILLFLIVMAVLVFIMVYDIKHKIIPDGLVITFSILALLKIAADFFLMIHTPAEAKTHLIWFLLAGPILASPLFFIWLFSKGKWMGLGDPKLVLGIGWFNWHGLKINGQTEVPFAPFLILGFLLVFFFNIDILNLGFLVP